MVNVSLLWLNTVRLAAVLSPGFLASYWSAGFGTFLHVSALASHWLEDYANIMPTLEENDQYMQRQPLLVQYKQQANPLLLMHNYTPLLISRNFKNKQITFLKLRKLAFTERNTLLPHKIIKSLEHLKNLKWPRPLFRPKTSHTCQIHLVRQSL
jgi:hypothetical protein